MQKLKPTMLDRVRGFSGQLKEAVNIGQKFSIPDNYLDIESIVVTGMGASAIVGDFLRATLREQLRIPLLINKSGSIPSFVNLKTLVVALSYSGSTKETIEAIKTASGAGAKVISLTSGPSMQNYCEKNRVPCIVVPPGEYSRTSLGYLLLPLLLVLAKMKLVTDIEPQISETIDIVKIIQQNCDPDVPVERNQAKFLAREILSKLPFIYGEYGFTDSAALRWVQQLNENSKIFALYNTLPEMAHVEINAWNASNDFCKNAVAILLRDKDYEKSSKLQNLVEIIKEILDKRTRVIDVWSNGRSPLARLLSLSYVGDLTSIYLAMLRGVDASITDNSSYIKGLEYM